eukprot:6187723-Pleurochrysis_carterae.AAC.1
MLSPKSVNPARPARPAICRYAFGFRNAVAVYRDTAAVDEVRAWPHTEAPTCAPAAALGAVSVFPSGQSAVLMTTREAGRLTPAESVEVQHKACTLLLRKAFSTTDRCSAESPAWWKATPNGSVRRSTASPPLNDAFDSSMFD